jgi:DNA polymerase-3 subunit chi
MTKIVFYLHIPNKMSYVCRLLRKAYHSGSQVRVVGPTNELAELNQTLWSFGDFEFIPHCYAKADPMVLVRTSIILDSQTDPFDAGDILVNFGMAQVPQGFERYNRMIELVSQYESDKKQARLRWKHYSTRGYAITQYNASRM